MAVRQQTFEYANLGAFLKAYEEHISKSSLFFAAGAIDKDVANEFKLDLLVPLIGRQGPIPAQVVHRGPDGSIGVHLPEIPGPVQKAIDGLLASITDIRNHLVESKQVVSRDDYNKLLKRLAVAETAAESSQSSGETRAKRTGRGIPIPNTSGRAPLHQGSLSDRSLRDTMVGLAVDQSTGLLTVKYPDGTVRYGYWLRGGPVGWRTDPMKEDEVLGVLLYKAEQITAEQIKMSLEIMKRDGCRQGEALVEMGLLDFATLIRVLGKQNEFVLQKVMTDRQGEWAFHTLDRLPEQFLTSPLKVVALLFRALYTSTREMRTAEINERIEPNLDRYLAISEESNHVLTEMQLNPKEQGLIDVIQSNSWRLREVYSVSPMGRAQTSALLWCLDELALLNIADQEDESRTKARIAEQIERKKKQLRGNHFDILDLHWVCLRSEVQDAYSRMKKQYDIERFSQLTSEQEELLEKIHARFDEAFANLESDSSRRRYRAEVVEKDAIANSADMLGKQGEMAIMRRDRAAACGAFAKAAELVPGEASFRDGLRRATTI